MLSRLRTSVVFARGCRARLLPGTAWLAQGTVTENAACPCGESSATSQQYSLKWNRTVQSPGASNSTGPIVYVPGGPSTTTWLPVGGLLVAVGPRCVLLRHTSAKVLAPVSGARPPSASVLVR